MGKQICAFHIGCFKNLVAFETQTGASVLIRLHQRRSPAKRTFIGPGTSFAFPVCLSSLAFSPGTCKGNHFLPSKPFLNSAKQPRTGDGNRGPPQACFSPPAGPQAVPGWRRTQASSHLNAPLTRIPLVFFLCKVCFKGTKETNHFWGSPVLRQECKSPETENLGDPLQQTMNKAVQS